MEQIAITEINQAEINGKPVLKVVDAQGKKYTVWKETTNGTIIYAYDHMLKGGPGNYEIETYTSDGKYFSVNKANKIRGGEATTKPTPTESGGSGLMQTLETMKERGIATNVGMKAASDLIGSLVKAGLITDADRIGEETVKLQKIFTAELLSQLVKK